MLIRVTPQDVMNGERQSASKCPVAHSCLRTLQPFGVSWVAVTGPQIYCYNDSGCFFRWEVTTRVGQFIRDFDYDDIRPQPIAFDLPIEEALKMQAKDGPTITPTELETIAIKLTPTKAEELCETTSPTSL